VSALYNAFREFHEDVKTQDALRKWTVGIYFAGDASLRQSMVLALKEIYRVGVTEMFNVVAQLNRQDAYPRRFTLSQTSVTEAAVDLGANESERGFVNQSDTDGRLGSYSEEIVHSEQIPRGSAAPSLQQAQINVASLHDFILEAMTRFPQDRFLIVLSGHGSGAIGIGPEQSGYCPGGIFTYQLERAFSSIAQETNRRIDILGLDSCYMSMVEVCWALRGKVHAVVASEGPVPNVGWPFHRILEALQCREVAGPRCLANALVNSYLEYYSDFVIAGESVDLSACDLTAADELFQAIALLADVLRTKLISKGVQDALVLAHWKAQSYKQEQYVDLWDFCDLLQKRNVDPHVSNVCQLVKDAVSHPERGVVRSSIYSGPDSQHSHGLAIYFPWAEVSKNYSELGFGKATGWVDFLEQYVAATRRELRTPPGMLSDVISGPKPNAIAFPDPSPHGV
jgi:hypothetical protein